jgi:tetratricopeptide (TPR) repeat protein
VDTEKMYDNVMNKFKWGGMDSENQIYMDENNLRMTNNLRLQFSNLAEELIIEQKEEKALEVLDRSLEVMPDHNVPFDKLMVPIAENYYELGENEKANEITKIVFERYAEDFEYYMSLDPKFAVQLQQDIQISYSVMRRLRDDVKQRYPQEGFGEEIDQRFQELDKVFDVKIQELEQYRTQPTMRF